ncbi:hypothetical protein K449DRAFT_384098 [Hypoxylon sp. EC38]|nr:hypothetical protein K449DRAFT_384098 [Hypoxylon sp. EC38]
MSPTYMYLLGNALASALQICDTESGPGLKYGSGYGYFCKPCIGLDAVAVATTVVQDGLPGCEVLQRSMLFFTMHGLSLVAATCRNARVPICSLHT